MRQEVFRLRRVLIDDFPQFAAAVLGEKAQWERRQMVQDLGLHIFGRVERTQMGKQKSQRIKKKASYGQTQSGPSIESHCSYIYLAQVR